MKICVFGADGKSGVEVVRRAIREGHSVVAFAYNKKAVEYLPKEALIIFGDVLNQDDVRKAISGVDGVISVVGHIKGSDPRMQTKGIKNIINAMENNNIKRIVSLTGTGVRQEGDCPSILDRLANFAVKILDPDRVMDGIEHARALEESSLDWTVLRVLKLSQGSWEDREYELTLGGPAENLTPRSKVAKVLLDLLTNKEFIKKMPVVSS